MRISEVPIFAVLALAIGLIGSGCSGSNPTTSGGGSDPVQKVQQKGDQNQMNPQPRDLIKQGGKLTWAIDGVPANFNYGELDGTNQSGTWILNAVLPILYTFDAGARPTFNPNYLASEPKVETSPKQVVTFELNPKAIWYDGTSITAADFIAQWKSLNGTNPAFKVSGTNGYDQIESVVQGANKFEVVATFKKSYADWKALFWPLYPASTSSDPKVFNDGWKDKMRTSAGPFKFEHYDATAKTYILVPNEKWWGSKPKLDAIIYRVLDNDAQPSAMANGEIDLMDVGPSANYYNKVKVIQDVDIRVAGGPNFRHLTFNGQSPMLKDVKVRQAVAMSIDRAAIARAQLGQLPVVPTPLGNHIFMANQAGYQDNSAVIAFDQAKARQMLDAAGWIVQGNKRVRDGKTLTLSMVIPGGVSVSRSESELIQNMLAQVNVELAINTVPTDDFFDKYVTPGRFDMTVFSWLGTQFPVGSSQGIYMNPVGNAIQQNYARTGSDQLDQLFREAIQELDPAKAIVKANEIDKLIWEEVHSLVNYQRPEIWAAKKGLANIGAYGFATIAYEDIGWVTTGPSNK